MTQWTIETLKEHIERIIDDRDTALKAALVSSQSAIDKAEARLNRILEGFPQEYGRKAELEVIEAQINAVKVDHVRRQEFNDMKDALTEGQGGRRVATAALGVIVALISVALGTMYANQLSHSDVSNQIDREAPWVADKPGVEEDIHQLQQQVILLKTQLASHEATDKIRNTLKK